ncbi:hypothetical protein ACNI3R_20100 [Rhizorhabdus sp. FW153]
MRKENMKSSGRPILLLLLLIGLLLGCRERRVEVSDPFYLDYIENPQAVNLRVCGDHGCGGIEGLPGESGYGNGSHTVAAGANQEFIAVEQKQIGNDHGPSTYYYFARRFDPKTGGAAHPNIIGPLDEQQFWASKAQIGLPDLTIRP